MSIVSPYAFLIVAATAVAAAALLSRSSRFYRDLVGESGGRLAALDGFRGFLAVSVFAHHAVIHYAYANTGSWQAPSSPFFNFLGKGAVSFFFMTSGFLFWSKAIDGKVAARKLLESRCRRILPMYWASAALVVAICWTLTAGHLQVSIPQLAKQVGAWVCGGLLGHPPINGVETIPINAGVTWSLRYEWIFYLGLPALAIIAKPIRFLLGVVAFAGLYLAWVHAGYDGEIPWNFLHFIPGMIAAYLVRSARLRAFLCTRTAALVTTALFLGSLVYLEVHPSRVVSVVASSALFFVVASGNGLLGVLRSRPALLLGHISYSVYLLHGIVLFSLMTALRQVTVLEHLTPTWYWGCCVAITPVLIGLAAVTYRWIEAPFMRSSDGARARALTARSAPAPR